MITAIEIKNFFSITETKINLVEQVRNYYGKELAPNFNSFKFWRIDENKVSTILSFFLTPNETHEQGDIYLKHFLKRFSLNFFYYKDNDTLNVECEFSTDKGRRIDIVISKNNFEKAIAIENKIYVSTEDQQNQISDYLDFLKRKTNDNFRLIYLSPQGKTISCDSISAGEKEQQIRDDKLQLLTYEKEMVDCINDFAMMTQNFRVKSFLIDFVKTLKTMYMGEKNVTPQHVVTDFINENERNLEISFMVANSLKEVKAELLQTFELQIREIGEELGLEVDGLSLKPHQWTKHRINFKYESGGLIYGLVRFEQDKTNTRITEIETKLKELMNEEFYNAPWWPIWQYFYRNIENDKQLWLDIKNGEAKKRAKIFVQHICNNFGNGNY